MFCGLKSAVLVLLLASSILALTAMVADYWIVYPSRALHIGILRGCDNDRGCGTVFGTEHVWNLLLSVFLIGLIFIWPCSIVELRYASVGGLGCFTIIGALSFLLAILGFAAMVSGAVILSSLFNEPYYFSWTFAIGWLSVVAAVASGAISIYISRKEPSPEPQVEAGTGAIAGTTSPSAPGAIYFSRVSRVFKTGTS